MNLLKISRKPAIVASPDDSVMVAVEKMVENKVGAIAVIENEKLVGIFTERDLMKRVVHPGKSVLNTRLGEAMTTNPKIAPEKMEVNDAFHSMTNEHFRHIPIVDRAGKVVGMLSVRHLMKEIAEQLSHDVEGLAAYISADGIGG